MSVRRKLIDGIRTWSPWLSAAVAATVFVCGLLWQSISLLGGGAALLCIVLKQIGGAQLNQFQSSRREKRRPTSAGTHSSSNQDNQQEQSPSPNRLQSNQPPQSTDGLVDELLATRRYALLLRPETKQHLSQLHVVRAIRQLDESMALVPAGRVLLGQLAEQSHSACGPTDSDPKLIERNLVDVAPVYLDRFCVTNEEYQRFIDSGGYEQLEFWHEEALPALLDFVDQSGAPGPRYWSDGQFLSNESRLPVVGISWYEAWAYARWVGKRLPTDAEWTKAGAWPVESAPGRIAQRRYPWGESFDVRRAHLYGSGQGGPVAVEEYPGGTSVGGIHQLIGNVWEWTATPLAQLADSTLHVSESVMSIRGGAFDTYFENQATCHFQSGEQSLSRRRNIGFRLALPMSDLEPAAEQDSQSPASTDYTQPEASDESSVVASV
jgi:gamma-glutamyl hercynylcysteine S-oxide synthase